MVTPTGPWLQVLRSASDSPAQRLLVFPPSGSGPATLGPLLRGIHRSVEVVGVVLPGRGARIGEAPNTCVDAVLEAVESELARHRRLPTLVFGHSLGGLLAALAADRLAGNVAALVISGSDPATREGHPSRTVDELIAAAGVTTPDVLADAEWRGHLHAVMQADLTLAAEARARLSGVRIDVPVTVLGGTRDPLVSEQALADWQTHTSRPIRIRLFDEGHFFLLADEHIDCIAALLTLPPRCSVPAARPVSSPDGVSSR
ncbi:alpha/beta fold hydrolase [Streptomyces roseofulvus]|uniref:thioesterase II family protein n=1 Tax=Streptomyces roseofulvus TaxID=33902 RepID=UPI0031FDB3FC